MIGNQITHLRKMFVPSDVLWESGIELVATELPCIMFTISTRIFFWGASCSLAGCTYGVWETWIKYLLPVSRCSFGKSFLKKVSFKFARMGNSFSLLCKYILIGTVYVYIIIYGFGFHVYLFSYLRYNLSSLKYLVLPFPFLTLSNYQITVLDERPMKIPVWRVNKYSLVGFVFAALCWYYWNCIILWI